MPPTVLVLPVLPQTSLALQYLNAFIWLLILKHSSSLLNLNNLLGTEDVEQMSHPPLYLS